MTHRTTHQPIRHRFTQLRLRTQLLGTVNIAVGVALALFLWADYRNGIDMRLKAKAASLNDEARTLVAAVRELEPMGPSAVQRHIDAVCASMNETASPGHTIEVTLGERVLVSDPSLHGGDSHDHAGHTRWAGLIAGSAGTGDVQVRIGERRTLAVSEARRTVALRAGALGLLGILATIILSVFLVRLVTRPLENLVGEVRAIRRGRFGTAIVVSANAELAVLGDEISEMSAELARREKDRRDQLDRARRLQSHLIASPRVEVEREIAIEYHPADEVAGDFVDVIACPNGDTLLCVADVVGHGIHAAMGSAVLKALLVSDELGEGSPAALLESINRRFCNASLPEDFASMILVRVDRDATSAVYASAGHEPGYLRTADGSCRRLCSTGLLLGVLDDSRYADQLIDLAPGDVIVLISDGISEAQNATRRLLGRDAITDAIRMGRPGDARSLAMSVLGVARRHRGDAPILDDETVLAFALSGPRVTVAGDSHASQEGTEPTRVDGTKSHATNGGLT